MSDERHDKLSALFSAPQDRMARMKSSSVTESPKQSDSELYAQFCAGAEEAFLSLYLRYGARVATYIRKIIVEPAEVDDLLQTVWMKMFRLRDTNYPVRNFEVVLFRVARNEAFLYLRKRQKNEKIFERGVNVNIPSSDRASAAVEQSEQRLLLAESLGTLPLALREVFVLKEQSRMEVSEIASVVGITENLVRVRYHRARHLLRKYIMEKLELTEGESPEEFI